MPLLNTAEKVYLGSQQVGKVYLGTEQVWPASGPFAPTSLPGLRIWLDASQSPGADGTSLGAEWPNLAPGGAPGTIASDTPGGRPPPVVSTTRLNGNKVVRFANAQGRVRMTNTGVKWDHTLVYVARMFPGGYNAGRIITAAYPPPNFVTGYWNGFEDVGYSTTGAFFTPDTKKSVTTNWRMYSTDAASSPEFGGTGYFPRLFNNGVLLCSGGTDGYCQMADAWWDTFNINGYNPTGYEETCDCEVAEVCLYNRKLSDAERQQVEGYLRTKWGL